jgi:hypothetical protein
MRHGSSIITYLCDASQEFIIIDERAKTVVGGRTDVFIFVSTDNTRRLAGPCRKDCKWVRKLGILTRCHDVDFRL